MVEPEEGHAPIAPSRRQLAAIVAAAFTAASIIFVLAVLPAEFRLDPTGVGRFLGLDRLAGPPQVQVAATDVRGGARPFTVTQTAYHSDVVDIPLTRSNSLNGEIEWKVRMKAGDAIVFSLIAPNTPELTDPDAFYYSFHGQSEPQLGQPGAEIKVTTFQEDVGRNLTGSLVAPYDGLWGWYLQNLTNVAINIHVQLAGQYEIASQEDIRRAASSIPRPPPYTPDQIQSDIDFLNSLPFLK